LKTIYVVHHVWSRRCRSRIALLLWLHQNDTAPAPQQCYTEWLNLQHSHNVFSMCSGAEASRNLKEPHHFDEAGAVRVTRYGYSSKVDVQHTVDRLLVLKMSQTATVSYVLVHILNNFNHQKSEIIRLRKQIYSCTVYQCCGSRSFWFGSGSNLWKNRIMLYIKFVTRYFCFKMAYKTYLITEKLE
jgi:hypothetical protein